MVTTETSTGSPASSPPSASRPISGSTLDRAPDRPVDGHGADGQERGAPIGAGWRSRWRAPSRSGCITAAIGALAAVLYTWDLGSLGDANSYYTAAVRAASESWKAFFFGSLDPGNFITVDKPPAAIWAQALSVRLLGFHTWTMLLPQALAGVGSVLILHRLVRRWAGDGAAHLAALALAVTPVAALMFRYNNPDALLTLLGLAAAWALWSAVETGRTRMLVLSAGLVGLAFDTKMLQAFLLVPVLGLVYLVAGPPRLGRRLLQLAAALVALVASSSWWVAIVALWPAAARPYIGSTDDDSILSLVLGYNGLGRIFGGDGNVGAAGGGAGGGPGGLGFGGEPGWLRVLNDAIGGQVSWLLPLALAGLVAGLWLTRRAPRTDRRRVGWLLWGGWALTCVVVFGLAEGTFHPYYTVQLAPAVAALAGAGAVALWQLGRGHRLLRLALPAAVVVTAGWAVVLLDRTPDYQPWLRPIVIGGAALAAAGLWLAWQVRERALVLGAGAVATVALLAGPVAYTMTTIGNGATGAIVAAGPSAGSGGAGGPGGGGFGDTSGADEGLVEYLEDNQGDATYLLAAFGSQSSAPFIIATGEPVVTIGGFTGSDPAPTLDELRQLVADGELRYVLVGGGGPGGGGAGGFGAGGFGGEQDLTQWITENGTVVDPADYGASSTDAGTLYDLAGAA